MIPLKFIQNVSGHALGTGTFPVTLGSTTTVGSFLIAMVGASGATLGGTFTGSDTAGNTWYDIAPTGHYSAGTTEITIMACNSNKVADTNTVTFTYSATHTNGFVNLCEYTNQYATSPIDNIISWVLTASESTTTFGPITANFQNEQLICFASTGSTATLTAQAGFTIRSNVNSQGVMDGFISAEGSYSPTWSNSAAQTGVITVVAVKSAPSIGTQASTPTFSPVAGSYTGNQNITLANTTPQDVLFVQAAPNAGSGITTVQFNQNTTPGNTYILTIYSSSGNQVTAVNDTEANTWVLCARQAGQAGDADEIEIWAAYNVVGGTQNTATVTCASGLGTNAALTIHEYFGLATSSAFDQHNGATGTTGTLASGFVTPSTAGQLIFSYFMSHTTGTGGSGLFANPSLVWSPLIPRYFNNCLSGSHQSASFDFVESAIQQINPSISTLGTFDWIALTTTFKPITNSARMDYTTSGTAPTEPLVNIVTDGDSFTQCDNTVGTIPGATQIGITYQQTAQHTLGMGYYFRNVGIGGQPVSGSEFAYPGNMINRASTGVDLFYVPGLTNICFIEGGLHDFADYSLTAAQVYAQITTYVAARQAMGWLVVVCTLPSWISGFDSQRLSLNTLIRSNTAGANGVCDWAGNANIGATNAYTNSTYFLSDGHMTQLSNTTIIAPLVVSAVQALISNPTGTEYTTPFVLSSSATVKATASSFNYLESAVGTAVYTITGGSSSTSYIPTRIQFGCELYGLTDI